MLSWRCGHSPSVSAVRVKTPTEPSLPLQEPSSIEKIAEVDTHIGVAMSGLTADARTLIEHARVETQVALA